MASLLEKLPNELLIHIFEYLSEVELAQIRKTCTRLYKIAILDRFWQNAYLDSPDLTVEQILLIKTFKRQPFIVTIELESLTNSDWLIVDQLYVELGPHSNITLL